MSNGEKPNSEKKHEIHPLDIEKKQGSEETADPISDEPLKGLNLTLAYSLLALAIFAAIGIALFIVLPFYRRN